MTDFLKIAKSIVVHFAHICAYGVETVNLLNLLDISKYYRLLGLTRVIWYCYFIRERVPELS